VLPDDGTPPPPPPPPPTTCTGGDFPGAPYPRSSFICDISWGAIRRAAMGSDTWPVTWADDGDLYTAFGDGWGFPPGSSQKLSLGLAKVSGDPTSFSGQNIPSPTGEQIGQGETGGKASGMLMVDGTLYMWMRNADGAGNRCRLGWSTDHARTWQFSSWTLNLGYCTFINYGQNYAGARDNYVYTVSHNHPNAYTEADDMVLIRVDKASLSNLASYQYLSGFDGQGLPTWSSNFADRSSVFHHTGHCLRSGISYNAGLGRYLWWQLYLGPDDPRFSGGFGVYEAPEPWGPWRTAYFVDLWDVGPGEAASFPTKWMSSDGQSAWLVFSGDDYFSVREAIFTIAQ